MGAKDTFTRIVRYLSVDGNQVLEDQINQPPIHQHSQKLPGQRVMLWTAAIVVVIGLAAGIWALSQ